MANKFAAAGLGGRAGLAHATFKGNFAGKGWWWKHHHHHFRPIIVIGWLGPLFWPYAYDDFIGYTFYPYAYDTFWPYAYDDVYEACSAPPAPPLSGHLRRGGGGSGRSDREPGASARPLHGQTRG
jgi:hypothetical protein